MLWIITLLLIQIAVASNCSLFNPPDHYMETYEWVNKQQGLARIHHAAVFHPDLNRVVMIGGLESEASHTFSQDTISMNRDAHGNGQTDIVR